MAELRPQHEPRGRERAMNNNNPEGYFFFTTAFAGIRPAGRVLASQPFRGPATEKDAYHAEWNVPIGRWPQRSRVPQAIAGDGECCAPASSMRNEERHMAGSASSRPFARRRALSCRQRHRSAQVRKNTNQTTLRISTASPVETVRRASTEGPGSAWRASV